MKKLIGVEQAAYGALSKHGSWCPGVGFGEASNPETARLNRQFLDAMKALVRKGYATVEMTDDGPRYHAS